MSPSACLIWNSIKTFTSPAHINESVWSWPLLLFYYLIYWTVPVCLNFADSPVDCPVYTGGKKYNIIVYFVVSQWQKCLNVAEDIEEFKWKVLWVKSVRFFSAKWSSRVKESSKDSSQWPMCVHDPLCSALLYRSSSRAEGPHATSGEGEQGDKVKWHVKLQMLHQVSTLMWWSILFSLFLLQHVLHVLSGSKFNHCWIYVDCTFFLLVLVF